MDLLCGRLGFSAREDPLAELSIVDRAVHVAVEGLEGLAELARRDRDAHDAQRAAELLHVQRAVAVRVHLHEDLLEVLGREVANLEQRSDLGDDEEHLVRLE